MSIFLLVIGLFLFVGLVVIHEIGHFVMARRGGVKVEEFGIGFPPRAKVLTKKHGTEYTLNWLPLGGFVRLKGEHDADKEPGSFGAARLNTKIYIMVAGVVMNLATAFVVLTIVAVAGMPQLLDNQFTVARDTKVTQQKLLVATVEADSPAQKAGLQERDQLLFIRQGDTVRELSSGEPLPDLTQQFAGKEVQITYVRDGKTTTASTVLRTKDEVESSKKSDEPKGYLGVSPSEYVLRRSTWSAPIVAGGLIKQFTVETFKGLGSALGNLFKGETGKASEQVSGPVGIFFILRNGSLMGYQFVLLIIAIISLTLAIMNILPIPALDGGRLFVTLIYHGLRKPLSQRTEDFIHGTGFAVLMLLFLLITVVDVKRFF
ncbi:MAG TPA: M50 family metallopeptidase [Verrucomicrobiae bacterium]|nr:M50 family metallopeptidase [Verrucomicrobiae bacterium]